VKKKEERGREKNEKAKGRRKKIEVCLFGRRYP